MALIFKQAYDIVDGQIQSPTASILLTITKKTATDDLVEFFGETDLKGSDRIKLDLISTAKGNDTLIPDLPILPLAVGATSGANHMMIKKVGNKIKSVTLTIQVGLDGALRLDAVNYLSLSTRISDLERLEIHTTGGLPTNLGLSYRSSMLQAGVVFEKVLAGANQIILDPTVRTLDLIRDGYSIQLTRASIRDVAESINDVVAYAGTEMSYTRKNGGETYTIEGDIKIAETYTGGTWYFVLGVTEFGDVKITADYDCYFYECKPVDLSALGALSSQAA